MGIFYSYCKNCNKCITWFLSKEDMQCRNCNTINTHDDRMKSFNNENYWIKKKRLDKLNKIKTWT